MISKDLDEKFKNHLLKANEYDDTTLQGLFDKYTTFFTCYNMLYNEVPEVLRKRGAILTGNDSDKKTAVAYVLQYLSGNAIIAEFKGNNLEAFKSLIKVIKLDIFNIKLDKGTPQKDQDALILAGLESGDDQEMSKAALLIIYYVRCNMVHGSKDFQEYQRILLEPLASLLQTLINKLYNALNGEK